MLKKLSADEAFSASLPDRCPAGDAQTLFISVIVPVRNEVGFIQQTLSQLVTQDYDSERFEIIVVDGESTDDTPRLVAEFAGRYENVRLFPNPRRLSSAARNIGIRHARGDVVLIVDGHCEIPDDQMLSNAAKAFDTTGADCLGRPQPLHISDATGLQLAIAAARSSWLGHHPDSYIYTSEPGFVPAKSVAVGYRCSVFKTVGYFDENFDACEDVEFNHRLDRAGLHCYFTPGITVRYSPRNTLFGLFRQLHRYGRGRVRVMRKHPATFSVRTLLPGLFVSGCVLGLPLAWLWAPLAVVYLAVVAMYLVLVLTVSIAIAIRHCDFRPLPWLPTVFLTVHFAAGTAILLEVLRPSRRWSGNGQHGAASTGTACCGPGRDAK